MFYIGYKSDYKTACRKQLNGAEYTAEGRGFALAYGAGKVTLAFDA